MGSSSSKQHAFKAVLGIGGALVLGIAPSVGMYYDTQRERVWLWILLLLGIVPALGWGSSHLARYRGYPGSGGCGLCIVGYIFSGFLGTTSRYPLALGAGLVFMVLLPVVVLLA